MNAITLRTYWTSKYEDIFEETYKSEKTNIELYLLSKLLKTYGQHLVLEAIDRFFKTIKKEKASILLFASNKYFNSVFKDLIKEQDIIEYKRMLPWYSSENQLKIKIEIQQYRNYLYAISLSQDDLDEMNKIMNKLKNIKIEQ